MFFVSSFFILAEVYLTESLFQRRGETAEEG